MKKLSLKHDYGALIRQAGLIATVASALASVVSAVFFFYSLRYSRQSLEVALQVYQHTLDNKMGGRYAFIGDDEYLVVRNVGPNVAHKITIRREPFFVFRDRVESSLGLGDELRTSKRELSALKNAGLITAVGQYNDLMGPSREFSIDKLDVGQESQLELSQFSNANAIKIAQSLGGIFVVRWHFDYELDPDGRPATKQMYFWVAPSNTREELSREPWGDSITTRIAQSSIQPPMTLLDEAGKAGADDLQVSLHNAPFR